MKKISGAFYICVILVILTACLGPYTSTTSMLTVLEKGHSNDYKEYWINVYDPNNQTEEEAFQVVVKEVMVWNLIEENKEYFATYAKEKRDKPRVLIEIEHTGPEE